MKKLFIVAVLTSLSFFSFSQTLEFSKDIVDPQEKKLISGLSFPGVIGSNYYINEINAGGAVFDGGLRSKLYSFDITSLDKKNEVLLNKQTTLIKADDYIKVTNIILNDKLFSFFLNKDDNNVYPVYYQSYAVDGTLLKEEKTGMVIDNNKIEIWNNKRDHATKTGYTFNVKKTFDGKRLITAVTSKTIDKTKSVISIAEWDEDMHATFSADHIVPLAKHMRYTKTILGKMTDGDFDDGCVLDVAGDKNGFIYALVQSANPANADDANLYWVYQFKKDDKDYFKSYRTEFAGHIMPVDVELLQKEDGNVYVVSVGETDGNEEKKNYNRVNSYYIGGFGADGKLTKILGSGISTDLLDLFDASDDKRQKKDDYINGLKLRFFHANGDGSMYVVWEQESSYSKEGAVYSHEYTNYGNVLVQYFNANKKLGWEKQVYKLQVTKDGHDAYVGLKCFYKNDNLFLFYPDDNGNATKDMADKKVEKFSLIKFGNKDLTGFYALSFNNKGPVKRNYFAWPEGKTGFAFNLGSIKYIGGTQFIAAARRIDQGVFTVDEKEFIILKFGL